MAEHTGSGSRRRPRPGGRSAHVRARVLAATLEALEDDGFDALEVPAIARRAGVHPTTIYRRWRTKRQLVGEALVERGLPLSATPDTGALRTDLVGLLVEGGGLLRTPAVRAMFEVLISQPDVDLPEILTARDRFVENHLDATRTIIDRAIARSELPAVTDPFVLMELIIGPAILRALVLGRDLAPGDAADIAGRALAALRAQPPRDTT